MEHSIYSLLEWGTLGCATLAAAILLWFLLRRPPLGRATKILLLLGIGVFPIGAASLGNIHGFEKSTERQFCGACHVMTPYLRDLEDPDSTSLAALHGRNAKFGGEACYECHRDYGMFGTAVTKATGMKHAFLYLRDYRDMPVEEALPRIELYHPYPNSNCMQCHSTRLPGFEDVVEHQGLAGDLASGKVSCASEGCHGYSHPFAKPKLPHGAKP